MKARVAAVCAIATAAVVVWVWLQPGAPTRPSVPERRAADGGSAEQRSGSERPGERASAVERQRASRSADATGSRALDAALRENGSDGGPGPAGDRSEGGDNPPLSRGVDEPRVARDRSDGRTPGADADSRRERGLAMTPADAPDAPGADESSAPGERAETDSQTLPDAVTRADLVALEKHAAELVLALGLVDPAEVERSVALAVPEHSVPAAYLEQARDDARRAILADVAILEALARAKLGPDASAAQKRAVSGLGHTLLSAQDDAFRMSQLEGIGARLGE